MKKTLIIFLAFFACSAFADSNPYAAESAIYRVEVPYPNGSKIGFGSGVLIARGKILTNCHVIKSAPGWPRVVNRKTGRLFSVTSYYNLGPFDACILVGSFSGVPVQLSTDFQVGENVWIFGYPAGLPVIGQGSVKALVDTDKGKSILLSAFCARGSSGGPVINSKGQLVGLNWGVYRYQNQCLSIPASFLKPYLIGT